MLTEIDLSWSCSRPNSDAGRFVHAVLKRCCLVTVDFMRTGLTNSISIFATVCGVESEGSTGLANGSKRQLLCSSCYMLRV